MTDTQKVLFAVEHAARRKDPATALLLTLFTGALGGHRFYMEPSSLVVMMNLADRDALIADAPDTYYLKEHYLNHPCVLVRLSQIRRDALRDLVVGAYQFVQNTSSKPSSPRPSRRNH